MEKQSQPINQTRSPFQNPSNPEVHLLTNIFIYSSSYYPQTKIFLQKIVNQLSSSHLQILKQTIKYLFSCIERQVILGPGSSYSPPSQIPRVYHEDVNLVISSNQNSNIQESFKKSLKGLSLVNLIKECQIKFLLWYSSALLSMSSYSKSHTLMKHYKAELEVDGQNWLEATPFSSLFLVLENALNHLVHTTQDKFQLYHLQARINFLHNKLLKYPVKKLSDIVLSRYRQIIQLVQKNKFSVKKNQYLEILLQYAFSLLFYYKYNQATYILSYCSNFVGMEMEFTGKLGRRTKYQSFDTVQLIMNLKEKKSDQPSYKLDEKNQDGEDQGIKLRSAKQIVHQELSKFSKTKSTEQLQQSLFDEDSILLEKPHFEEQKGQEEIITKASEQHILVSLAIIYNEYRSTPYDQILFQNISAAIITLLSYKIQLSYPTSFSLLLLRSLNEFPRIKNVERALDQFQKLKNYYNQIPNKSTECIYATPFETHLSYIMILADKYMEIGLSMSAIQLYEQTGLFEQCIDGLIQKDYKEKALQLANKLIEEKGKNARLLCMLGDIHKGKEGKDEQYYIQSWQLSDKRFSRAQRSLGWLYFQKNDFKKSAEAFTLATEASFYHPGTWFTLGCCYMRLNEFEKAIRSFGQSISIDQTQGQAWGNLSSCYIYLKKNKQAYSTLEQAVKHSENNWKLWSNLLSVSLSIKKFYKFFEAIEKLVNLGHKQVISQQTMSKVVMILQFKRESQQGKRSVYYMKNRIERLFDFLQKILGENSAVWQSKTSFQIELLNYTDSMVSHYTKLHKQNKVDPNDILTGYQSLESIEILSKSENQKISTRIVNCKQTQLNMVMKIGWEQNKMQGQKVKKVAQQYVAIYQKYSKKEDLEQHRLFIKGIQQKLEKCLETQCIFKEV